MQEKNPVAQPRREHRKPTAIFHDDWKLKCIKSPENCCNTLFEELHPTFTYPSAKRDLMHSTESQHKHSAIMSSAQLTLSTKLKLQKKQVPKSQRRH